ncbi:hypothetical protein D3C87_1767410 [compost metagenome]
MHDQNQLTQHQAQVGSDHVTAEHQTALLGLGLLVEPAFDDHVLAHHAKADDDPQKQPRGQPVHQAMAKHRRTDDPGTRRIGSNMPDPGNQPMADLATQHQAEIVGCHQRTDPQAVDVIGRQAQGQVST